MDVKLLTKVSLLSVSLFMVSCSTTNQPVVIREAGAKTEPSSVIRVEPAPRPVSPEQPKTVSASPLKNKLLQQSRQKLASGDADGAIALSERGLRIDRKEPYFYQYLSSAYQLLGNKKQSVYFAKQGLRYAPKNTSVYQALMTLSK